MIILRWLYVPTLVDGAFRVAIALLDASDRPEMVDGTLLLHLILAGLLGGVSFEVGSLGQRCGLYQQLVSLAQLPHQACVGIVGGCCYRDWFLEGLRDVVPEATVQEVEYLGIIRFLHLTDVRYLDQSLVVWLCITYIYL